MKHSVHIKKLPCSTFHWILEVLYTEWRNSTLRYSSLSKRGIKILNISFPRVEFEPTTIAYSVTRPGVTKTRNYSFELKQLTHEIWIPNLWTLHQLASICCCRVETELEVVLDLWGHHAEILKVLFSFFTETLLGRQIWPVWGNDKIGKIIIPLSGNRTHNSHIYIQATKFYISLIAG